MENAYPDNNKEKLSGKFAIHFQVNIVQMRKSCAPEEVGENFCRRIPGVNRNGCAVTESPSPGKSLTSGLILAIKQLKNVSTTSGRRELRSGDMSRGEDDDRD